MTAENTAQRSKGRDGLTEDIQADEGLMRCQGDGRTVTHSSDALVFTRFRRFVVTVNVFACTGNRQTTAHFLEL